MPQMSGGHAVVRALQAEGVEVVFGLPGVQIMHIYDGFFDAQNIRVITCRHEQTTVYMADGYARSTGKIGVALVVPGPGAYNAGAAMSTAYAASSPVLLISGQIDSQSIGKDFGALHEIQDQLEFMKPVVKWNDLVTRAESIPEAIHTAIEQLKIGRPRPVELEIPPDTLGTIADIDLVEPEEYSTAEADATSIRSAAEALANAKRPVIWAGGGVIAANAAGELTALSEALNAPVITTQEGKGAIPESHPLSMGVSAYGWGVGGDLIPQSDVVIAVGSRLGSYRPEPGSQPTADQTLINLNIDATEIDKTTTSTVGIVTDAKVGLRQISAALQGRKLESSWTANELTSVRTAAADRMVALAPKQTAIIKDIRNAIPEDGFVVGGITNLGAWSSIAFDVLKPRTFITSSYMGTLGYAFPTSLGVKIGNPDKAVVALCGDGGFMYAIGELATAVQYGINAVAVVFNNHRFGASNRDQHLRFGGRNVGTELLTPDFVKLADSFGALGIKVDRLEDSPNAIEAAIAANRPAVIEVEMPPDLDPPYYLNPRG
ncbi:MAG: thiamine pyrophosphate-dependent enzyme [Chloroflexota bacterium]|nr:thiamine pyrophosphate-dependent enzyme [Chloroflexota bacterium]